jgi:hypothetical protein
MVFVGLPCGISRDDFFALSAVSPTVIMLRQPTTWFLSR